MRRKERTIPAPILEAARRHPDREALCDGRRSVTYADLERAILAEARRLGLLGVQPGDRVGLLAANTVPAAVAIHTLRRIGAVSVPLHPRYSTEGWRRCLRIARCRLLLADPERTHLARGLGPAVLPIPGEPAPPEGASRRLPSAAFAPPPRIAPDRTTTILFTSGSTGRPRGVPLTFENFRRGAIASTRNIPLSAGDRWLAVLPLCHAGGMAILFRTLLAGCSAMLDRSFDPASVNHRIDDGWITHVSLVPTMLEALLADRGGRPFPDTLRVILLGGAPVPPRLLDAIVHGGVPALLTYGMTEAASQIATQSPSEAPHGPPVGVRPLPHVEIRIIDAEGRPAALGQPGEIQVRGSSIFSGYLGPDPVEPIDAEGWFRTGDAGLLDAEGRLYLRGRLDDTIISGGEKIRPVEIESVAGTFGGVAECVVIGVEDERWGERPLLLVRVDPERFAGVEALRTGLAERLSSILLPERIEVVKAFPRTPIGKIDRVRLRALYGGAVTEAGTGG